jgi:hypothetical protein
MITSINQLAAKRANLARLAVGVFVLLGAAPVANAQLYVSSPVDGNWRMRITPDAAAKALGREAFDEYITIDGYGFTGMETSRLGFDPAPTSTGLNLLGCITYSVTMTSANHGKCTSVGSFNLLNTEFTGTLTWVVDSVTYKYTYVGVRYTPTAPEYES